MPPCSAEDESDIPVTFKPIFFYFSVFSLFICLYTESRYVVSNLNQPTGYGFRYERNTESIK